MRTLILLGAACAALAACNKDEEARQPTAGECAGLTAVQVRQRSLSLDSSASMNGVDINREHGSSHCKVQGDAILCDLNDPGVVSVTPEPGARPTYFEIPPGRNASITVSGGQAACTLS